NLALIHQMLELPTGKQPATARQLMLSSLGAWLDVNGKWPGQAVESWRHRIAMGRDQKVQVVQKGRLYPFGNEAVLTTSMERHFTSKWNGPAAELMTRNTLWVKDPIVDFGEATDKAGRRWPWRKIELLTDSFTGATATAITQSSGSTSKSVLVLLADGDSSRSFTFSCIAEDRGKRVSVFDLPLLFVPDGFTAFAALNSWFGGPVAAGYGFGAVDLDGQTLALAPADGAGTPPDTTTVVASRAGLTVESGGPLGFRPVMPHVDGIVPAVARFAGAAGSAAIRVTLAQAYADYGFDAAKNAGQALLSFAGPVIDL